MLLRSSFQTPSHLAGEFSVELTRTFAAWCARTMTLIVGLVVMNVVPCLADGAVVKGGPSSKPVSNSPSPAPRITFPHETWEVASIQLGNAKKEVIAESIEITGKVSLDEDHLGHVFPMVEGVVDEVRVQFGDKVQKGDVLVVVQSREVGQAMLQLYQDRLQQEVAAVKDKWTQTVAANTHELIKLIRSGAAIDEIEQHLQGRPIGEHRDTLLTAYIDDYRSQRNYDRLKPLSKEGTVSGKQFLEAESQRNAARATLQSLIEQIQQDATQSAILSTYAFKELTTRVAVDATYLKILGFDEAALKAVNPETQGEAIAHYPIVAPFDGTIISKDVVLLERVGPEIQILSIADLSKVWVTADIYEQHLPLLQKLNGKTVKLHADAWPDREFEAKVFYTGDIVHETTRTVSLRAVAENSEGLLKPGMFVNVKFPMESDGSVVSIPLTAIQEHEGRSFVFVNVGGDEFERRDVQLGRRNDRAVEVISGVKEGDPIAIDGGFALKSQMLADLLSE